MPDGRFGVNGLTWCAVPVSALVEFLIAGAQVSMVRTARPMLLTVAPVYLATNQGVGSSNLSGRAIKSRA